MKNIHICFLRCSLHQITSRWENNSTKNGEMSRMLCIALENKVDMANVLTYPLTPVPPSLCHFDGLMQKTDQVKLSNHLESIKA